jgi:hypothetical protein
MKMIYYGSIFLYLTVLVYLTTAEKLGFMKARTVKVCAKAITESSPRHNNPSFLVNSRKNCLEKENS